MRASAFSGVIGPALTGLLLLCRPAAANPDDGRKRVYVRAGALPGGNGYSPAHAVPSLETARDIARKLPQPRVIYISGEFIMTRPLELSPVDSGTSWIGETGAALRGNGRVAVAINGWRLNDTTFRNFSISEFTRQGIRVVDAKRLNITQLSISEILSNNWSQSAIDVSGKLRDIFISYNNIKNVNYNGIGVFSNFGQNQIRVSIIKNRVLNTCRSVADCGAIYLGGRGQNQGSRVIGNTVIGFGPPSSKGRGIYLDDWESNVIVSGNCIAGPGIYGVHIHGGHTNIIKNNRIDIRRLSAALLNQANSRKPMRSMKGNRFINNVIYKKARQNFIEERQAREDQIAMVSGNSLKLASEAETCQ